MVHGSRATGIDDVPAALRKIAASESEHFLLDLPLLGSTIALVDYLKASLRNKKNVSGNIFCYATAPTDPKQLAAVVESLTQFCADPPKVRNKWLRVILLLPPESTESWCSLPMGLRQKLENESDYVLNLKPWNQAGIRQRLAHEQKLHPADVCERIAMVTGGWPILLDKLLARCAKSDNPRPALLEIETELEKNDALANEFIASIGASSTPSIRKVWNFLRAENGAETELIHPDFIDPTLTRDECLQSLVFLEKLGFLQRVGDQFLVDTVVSKIWRDDDGTDNHR